MPYGKDVAPFASAKAPIKSELIGFAQVIELTGVNPARLGECIEFGFVSPVTTGQGEFLFAPGDLVRLGKMERLCRDFELPVHGVGIIVELLERIEALEEMLRDLRRGD